MKLEIVVMVSIVVMVGASDSAGIYDEKPRTFCGRHLANARFVYCFGAFENMRKRSTYNTSPLLALLYSRKSTARDLVGMLHSLRDSHEITSPIKRIGIADECCLKPCYISDLLNYC